MAFDDDLLELMPFTITIASVTSVDKFNKRTYGSAVSYRCRIVARMEQVVTEDGRQAQSSHILWVAPPASGVIPNLRPNCKLTLPDGTTPPVLAIETYPDEDGNQHMKIFLERPNRE
jgi:hypothetical protein